MRGYGRGRDDRRVATIFATPILGELLSERLVSKPAPARSRPGVDELEMTDLVEEDLVQHQPPNGQERPRQPRIAPNCAGDWLSSGSR